ncbi:polysaccharide biosynthesis protein [Chryseobacterium sp. CBSDS_008]|uniref:polysaccharide biosynthesis protein n=1 Tax=Chryseobacterium sp. CBSDS_008 TaxID=3415265 RepID=UPI003CF7CA5D
MGEVFKIRELRYIPRWSVFLIDISVIFFSVLVSYLILESLKVKINFIEYQNEKIFSVVAVNILFILLFKTYAGVIRHSTFFDFFKIIWSSGSALIVLLGLNFMTELALGKPLYLYPVLFLFFFISIFLMFLFRMITKQFFGIFIDPKKASSKARVAVVGVGDASIALANAIIHNPDHPYKLAGFLLYELQLELLERFPNQRFKFVLADITNYSRMEKLFADYQFSIVYHAAAYKHVPLIEDNPHEAIFVNIGGTKNLSLLAKNYYVDRFVMVSTDKAVNPTNVMGASKRAAELFVQSLQSSSENTTKFITTRFGNVLGSNGSVIPHFKKQIEKGGPVTITHPDIIRYFMTIPEACELVLQAGTMGQGGEIYVFDMGKPVKILDLAERMIKLSGYTPGIDIKIDFIGLRPGEKLYEELLTDNSTTIPTHHEKIMISRDPLMEFEDIEDLCKQIILSAMNKDSLQIVKILKVIVPEFISNNSEFEILDKISEHEVYE